MEKYESEEVLNKSFLIGVDYNGLGLTEYGGVVNGSSGGLLKKVGYILMAEVEVIFN